MEREREAGGGVRVNNSKKKEIQKISLTQNQPMLTAALKIVGEEVLKKIIDKTGDSVSDKLLKVERNDYNKFKADFPDLYSNHLNEICKWASSIPFIGLSKPKNTEGSTIELMIGSDIVKTENELNARKISEQEILDSNDNVLLIGAPGAGKTTTLKRLILRYLSDIQKQEKYGFPILVRLRDIPPDSTLTKYILDIFRIPYHERLIKTYRKKNYRTKAGIEVTEDEIVEKLVTHVGDTPIINFLADFLNEAESILLLDGLDEIDKEIQDQTYKDIQKIGLKLNRAKILLTIRKSELRKVIDKFLCAKHLVNLPYSQDTIKYFLEYPEPLAIAVSISGEPSLWFSNLMLNSSLNINNFRKQSSKYYASVYSLINRLLVESPSFKVLPELGFTFFYLAINLAAVEKFRDLLDRFFSYSGVYESFALAISDCHYINSNRGYYTITKRKPTTTEYFIEIPYQGDIPEAYINLLVKEGLIKLEKGIFLHG